MNCFCIISTLIPNIIDRQKKMFIIGSVYSYNLGVSYHIETGITPYRILDSHNFT